MTDSDSNYVAAWQDWDSKKIVVLERDSKGNRIRKHYDPPYYMYVGIDEDEESDFDPSLVKRTIFGELAVKATFSNRDQFEAAKKQFKRTYESDVTPVRRVLMDNYYKRPAPNVNYAFFDIEVDYTAKLGWARPSNPYAPVNAVTVYQSWTDTYQVAVVPPKGWKGSQASIEAAFDELEASGELITGSRPNFVICQDEVELLNKFLEWIYEADIISGWNSEFFDVPYLAERLFYAGGDRLLARFDVPGAGVPKKEEVTRFGTSEIVRVFRGRAHLDYLALFKKFTFEGRSSYKLGNILQEEVNVGKLEYDGTLEELYNKDFERFTLYNLRDVSGLVQLNRKLNFIMLANNMAHASTVKFDAVLGTVSFVETAITNHVHYELGKITRNKIIKESDKVEGAIVLTPHIGLHDWGGSVDLNSLYPNTIRSLNISPEMIVGQFTEDEKAWAEVRAHGDREIVFEYDNGDTERMTGAEWNRVLGERKWAISAFGTVFNQGNGEGVVAQILGIWYAERKQLQREAAKWEEEAIRLKATLGRPV